MNSICVSETTTTAAATPVTTEATTPTTQATTPTTQATTPTMQATTPTTQATTPTTQATTPTTLATTPTTQATTPSTATSTPSTATTVTSSVTQSSTVTISTSSTASTTLQIVTTSTTSGNIASISTTVTQTSKDTGSSQSTTQSTNSLTTITTQFLDVGLPIENLLNIKYAKTTSHNWYFSSTAPMIKDNGSPDNFLNFHLQFRFPNILANFFPDNTSTHYFTPVGVVNSLPAGFILGYGVSKWDSASIILPSNGACLQLFNISTDKPYNAACLSEPETCEYGFSAALWIQYQNNNLKNRDYILTSGPDGVQGFKFYHQMGQLYIQIRGRNTSWKANMPFSKNAGSWSIVAFSWRRYTGEIRLLVGDQFVLFNNTVQMHNMNLNPSQFVYLGCMVDLSGFSDPTASSAMNVAHIGFWLWPVRLSSILSGEYVYQIVQQSMSVTTPPTTSAPIVVIDYSKIINEVIGNTSDVNPFYYVADEYISVANTQITSSSINNVTTGRAGFHFNGPTSYIDITQQRVFANNCPTVLTACTSGLSLSMWLKIPNTTNSGDILEIVNNIKITYSNNVVTVIMSNGTDATGRSTNQIVPNIWQNLGLTGLKGFGNIKIYINGIEDTATSRLNNSAWVRGSSSSGINNGDFVLGSSTSNTLTGLELSDIVLWRRNLISSESHKFLGYTQSQFNQLQTSSNYWTTDKFINLNAKHQIDRQTVVINPIQMQFSLSSVLKMKTTTFVMDSDPFSKSNGQCPILNQLQSNHLFLARSKLFGTSYQDSDINWTGHCLTDPCLDKCRYSGITISMWIKIKSVSLTKIQFFFNSGDMANNPAFIDGRGISYFIDQQLFGISLSSCINDWSIIIDANRYQLNQWINVGLLWREDLGLTLLINGIDYGLINNIPDQIYKPIDYGFRAVIGRFDTDDQSLWSAMGFWEMSNFVFGEMSYFTQYLTPDVYANIIGLVNNMYFSEATLLRIGNNIINQPIQDLLIAKDNRQSYNYEGRVRWDNANNATKIIFGRIPIMIDVNNCPTNALACSTGFSIGGWFFITDTLISSLATSYNLIIQGDVSTMGFGIRIYNNRSIYGWVKTDSLYNIMVSPTSFYASFNQWISLGMIWQKGTGIILLINGKDFFSSILIPSPIQTITDKRVFVGDSLVNVGSVNQLLVYNIAFYNYSLNLVQLQKLFGIQYNQVLLFSKGSIMWTMSGLYYTLIQKQIQMIGVTYSSNKYDTPNSAICTAGSDQSYIALQSKVLHCIQNPDNCTSFVLIINIKFSPLILQGQTSGFILTMGNNQSNVKGVSIIQTSLNTLEFWTRNSSNTCKSVMTNFTTGSWVQLKFIWSSLKNQIVKVDENTKVAAINALCISENNNKDPSPDIIIGRNPSGKLNGAKVCISEVMLMHVLTSADPETASSGLFSNTCYQNMDMIYPLTGSETDQYQMPLGATKFINAIIADNLPLSCLTSPSTCSNGLTISLWVKVDQITGNNIPLISVGKTAHCPLLITLSTGTNASSFAISATLNTGKLMWYLMQDSILVQSVWTNIGLTWNYGTGLNLFINGIVVKGSTISVSAIFQDTIPTSITIGKNIAGALDNIVVWFTVVASCQTPQASNKLLAGSCKTDVTIPAQRKCAILSNCNTTYGSICIDQTSDNVIQIANSGMQITSTTDAIVILNLVYLVVNNTESFPNLTMAAVSLLSNAANNVKLSGPLTFNFTSTLLLPFVTLNGELMGDKYLIDWIIMDAQNVSNAMILINTTDNFYLRVATLLSTSCTTLSIVQGIQGVTLLQIDPRITNCNSLKIPNYSDSAWSSNITKGFNPQDTIQIDPKQIPMNNQIISIASSIYNSQSVIPLYASSTVNPNSIALDINSKVLTINANPPFYFNNQSLVYVQFMLNNPNPRPDKAQAWDVVDPVNSILTYQWFPVFWSTFLTQPNSSSLGSWDNTGCTPTTWNSTLVTFACNHMTAFTILMEPVIPPNTYLMMILSYITLAGLGISLLCLLIFIITIIVSKHLNGTRYIIHLNMACSLLMACIAFILVEPAQWMKGFCQAVGLLMHFFFLATFGWLFIESLYVFYAITAGKMSGRFKCYVPVAWGLPILVVATTAGLNIDSYGRNKFCWLNQSNLFIWAFLGPIILLLFMTLLMCLIVACNLSTPAVHGEPLDEVRSHIKQTAVLLPFLLIGWIFGIIYVITSNIVMAFIFVILCSLEGLWVLLFFGLMNQDFRYALCRRTTKNVSELETAIIDGIETESSISIRGDSKKNAEHLPPPKASAPIYYTGNSKSRPPRHMNSVEFSRPTLRSEKNLINQSYIQDEYEEDIETNTLQNNGLPIHYNRSIPGTPQYQE